MAHSSLNAAIPIRFAPEDLHSLHYSYRRASTGFLVAARQLCTLTVRSAMPRVIKPARAKIHQLISVLYAKFCSHLCIAYQATGHAITKATEISFMYLAFNKLRISRALAPLTFLIPISFVLL